MFFFLKIVITEKDFWIRKMLLYILYFQSVFLYFQTLLYIFVLHCIFIIKNHLTILECTLFIIFFKFFNRKLHRLKKKKDSLVHKYTCIKFYTEPFQGEVILFFLFIFYCFFIVYSLKSHYIFLIFF